MKYICPTLFAFFVAIITINVNEPAFAQQTAPAIAVISESDSEQRRGTDIFAQADMETVNQYIPVDGAPFGMFAFLLRTDENAVLFDAGLGGETWVQNLEKNIKPEEIKLVLLTHLHGDHIGGLLNGDARRFPNAKLLCSVQEYEHWFPADADPRTPQLARIKAAYGQDFATFNFDDEVFADSALKIKAIDAVGHTPGHTVFLIETVEGYRELIIGDLLHVAALQFPKPDICSRFDMDKEKTVAARKRILDFAVLEKIPVRGMHLPGPAKIVENNGQGGYRTGVFESRFQR